MTAPYATLGAPGSAKGMPTVPSGGKKPRFNYLAVRAWILSAREHDPVVQAARDRVFKQAMKGVGA